MKTILSFLAAALFTGMAYGNIIIYEGFDYTASGNLADQAGGTGFGSNTWGSNNEWTITNTSLSYGSLVTTGNATVATRTSSNIEIFRDFSTTVGGDTTSIWMSFLVSGLGDTFNGLSTFNGSTEGTFAGALGGTVGGRLISGSSPTHPVSGGTQTIADTLTFSAATTYMIVMHFDMTSGAVHSAWVNPDLNSLGTGSAPTVANGGVFESTSSNTLDYAFDRIRLGLFNGSSTVTFDEIRIGESWIDVSPVPEPSSYALMLGIFGGALAACRRRRRRA